jgi:prevent-host-death family protein
MAQVSALEFQRNFDKYQDLAHHEPVEITRHGRAAYVLLTAEHYQWLQAAVERRTAEIPDAVLEAVKRDIRRAQEDPETAHLYEHIKVDD